MADVLQYGLLGLGTGAIYALLAQGMIVIYSGSGVLNLAHGAMALLGGLLFWQLRVADGWAFAPAVLVSVAVLSVVGMLTHQLVMRPLSEASMLARVVATLGLLLTIQGAVGLIWGEIARTVPPEFPSSVVEIAGARIPEHHLWLLGIAVILTALLSAAYRWSLIGLAVRGGSENPRAAAALGWSADLTATLAWGFGGGLAALAGILIAPLVALSNEGIPLLIIPVLAAALLGSLRSFWLTLLASIAIGIGEAELINFLPNVQGVHWALPFAFIVVVLVIRGKGLPVRGETAARLPEVGTGEIRWVAAGIAVLAGILLCLFVFPLPLLGAMSTSFAWAILMLSAVVLLGYTGQLSFEQMAMAGIAALIAARLVSSLGFPFELAVIVALLAAVPVGVAFALPAFRTRGINLAVVTLGLGAVVANMVLANPSFYDTLGGIEVGSISIIGIPVDAINHPDRWAAIVFTGFAVCAVLVANVRRGRAGSALIAVRTNERAAAALGINVVGAKLFAFVVGATLAGIGGILLSFYNPTVSFGTFTPFNSILVVAYAVIGGIGFTLGPVVGSQFVAAGLGGWIMEQFWSGAREGTYWLVLAGGVTVMLVMIAHPHGGVQLMTHQIQFVRRRLSRKGGAKAPGSIDVVSEPAASVERNPTRPLTLEVRDLVVRFGGVTAVDNVSLKVEPGEIVGLIGPNGAGKTTVIDAVTGFVRPAEGDVLVDGTSILRWPTFKRARAGVGRSFQSLELFESSTLHENLRVASDDRAMWRYYADVVVPRPRPLSSSAAAAADEFRLTPQMQERVSDLSFAQRRLAAIARSVASEPSLLLLDEPVGGLTGQETAELAEVVRRFAKQWGIGVLVVEHDMQFVMGLCDRIIVLDFGRRIAEGTPDEVRADPAVRDAYLGNPESSDDPTEIAGRAP
jgi:ABC-type branched-subunit amino acid transport system ATPase component/branched-subunit amino acid ABC-type transport system permease component